MNLDRVRLGLYRQDRTCRIEEDSLGVAAQQQLADWGSAAEPNDNEIGRGRLSDPDQLLC
jgi:hypothetical protein